MAREEFQGPEGKTMIPIDANSWELYSDMKGVGRVARSLTAALKRAIMARYREDAIKIMATALEKHTNFGAGDTEPRAVAERCLSEARGGDYSWTL